MCLENVSIIRDGMARVNRCDQWCYFVSVCEIDHILHIVTKNLCVDIHPAIIFDAERQQIHTTNPPQDDNNNQLCSSQENVKANVNAWSIRAKEIAEIRRQGIEVDNDNKPAPEGVATTSNTTTK